MEIIISLIQSGFSHIVPFVVLLGVLIFVHELGHFLVARWCGVRVEVFSLGFGKKIFQYKKGDTNYCISLVPLGGYVKMFGEQPGDEISAEDKSVSFTHKKVGQRIAIVLAGPIMNFLFAILVFFVVATIGEEAKRPMLGDIEQNSAAYVAGLRSGDTLLSVNNHPVKTYDEFSKALTANKNKKVTIEVQRDGDSDKSIVSADVSVKPNPNPLSLDTEIGDIEGLTYLSKATVVGIQKTSPLTSIGLKTGDRITSINGNAVNYWRDLEPTLGTLSPEAPLTLEIERQSDEKSSSEKISVTLAPTANLKAYSLASLGIESAEFYLYKVVEKSPAQNAGLSAGDRILSVNNVQIQKWEDVIGSIKNYTGATSVPVVISRGGEVKTFQVTPQLTTQMTSHGSEDKRYTIGIMPMPNITMPDPVLVRASGPIDAIAKATVRTVDISVLTVLSFVRLFQNKVSPKNIGGIISIGQAASETFKIGMSQFLTMMGLISVNLFILNLLPIPVLDGGHLVFYLIEFAKGSPLSLKKMEMAQQVGLVLLMSLMVFALFNDVTRLFGSF